MTESLNGTVALVTGASSGIGEATARSLAASGSRVSLVARRIDRIERLAKEIGGTGHTALAIECDVTDRRQVISAVERTVSDFGRLDVLVNNAGVMLPGPVTDSPVEEWDRMIDVNLKGVLYATHAALPHLLRAADDSPRGVADLVNVSSNSGRVASANYAVYALTKHGVGAFSEAVRKEVTGRGVRVSIIEPGAVDTELTDHIRPEVRDRMRASGKADSEPLHAPDIADLIEYAVTRPRHVSLNELLIQPTAKGS